jgi:HSP20 family molecular chaperone IbpA
MTCCQTNQTKDIQNCGCAPTSAAAPQHQVAFAPPCDIADHGAGYTLVADLPGCTKDSINITFEDGVLTLDASPAAGRRPETAGFLRREYGLGAFRREFRLGEDVNVEAIAADFVDGVLTVQLPKVPAPAPRKVTIRAA